MAATKAQLIAKIEDDLTRSDITTQITDAVDFSVSRYERERFWFNDQDNISVTLTSSVAQLALTDLPVKMFEIDRLRLKLGSGSYLDMYPRDRAWIATRQDVMGPAMPIEYCIYDEALQFDTKADQSYTLVLDGIVGLGNTAASNCYSNGSVATWFNEARNLIRSDAKRDVYIHVLKDYEKGAAMKQVVDYEYAQLKARTNILKSTGMVRPTRF